MLLYIICLEMILFNFLLQVNITCGLENEVLSAHEPNKCEYVLEFQTPAACRLPGNSGDLHDEL